MTLCCIPPTQSGQGESGALRAAMEAVRRGDMVVVADDCGSGAGGAGGGVVVITAQHAVPERIAFMLAHTSGLVSVAMAPERLDELNLPLMAPPDGDRRVVPYTVTVDALTGTTTGISAWDRAVTIRALIDRETRPNDLGRPGHVFPVRTDPAGVLRQERPAEAALDLVRACGHYPAAVLCEVVSPDKRRMANGIELRRFAESHGLPMVDIGAVVGHRHRSERLARRVAQARIPTRHGTFISYAYQWPFEQDQDLALVRGTIVGRERVLVAIHRECPMGDVFGSYACPCARSLDESMRRIDQAGGGALVYLRSRLGRRGDPTRNGYSAFGGHQRVDVPDGSGGTPSMRAAHIVRDLGIASAILEAGDAGAPDLEALGVVAVAGKSGGMFQAGTA